MELSFFKRRSILKKTDAFELIPIRRCEHRVEENGNVTLLIPKFKNEKWAAFILGRRSCHIQIHLDGTGTKVWLEIDGLRNIRIICDNLRANMGEDFSQVEQRVNKFMTRLYDERYITFRQLEDALKQGKHK